MYQGPYAFYEVQQLKNSLNLSTYLTLTNNYIASAEFSIASISVSPSIILPSSISVTSVGSVATTTTSIVVSGITLSSNGFLWAIVEKL